MTQPLHRSAGVATVDTSASGRASRRWWRRGDAPARAVASEQLAHARVAGRLLAHAQSRLAGRLLLDGVDGALRAIPGWLEPADPTAESRPCPPPDAVGVRVGGGVERTWRIVGADGQVRDTDDATLPRALLDADADLPVVLVSRFALGDGLDPMTRRGAYLWVTDQGERAAVFAVEWSEPAGFGPDERVALHDLQQLLEERIAADRQLDALRRDAELDGRRRMAADLHDDLGQDLSHLAVELDLLARTTPQLPELAGHADTLRAAIGRLRARIAELRADR